MLGGRPLIGAVVAFGSAIAALGACQLVFPTVADDAAALDARLDSPGDGGAPRPESGPTDRAMASGPYHDFTDPANWEAYDFSSHTYTFAGGAFDGRYLYLAPWGGKAARYDTRATFTKASSWEGFDTRTISEAGATGALGYFTGAVFDGRYVYLIPQNDGISWDYVVARFDTTASRFDDLAAWASFDATTAFGGMVQGFAGATFDGRFIYLVPDLNGTVLRYDTKAPFLAQGSWTPFNLKKVNPGATGLVGAIFDGRYVYLIPFEDDAYVLSEGGITGTEDGFVMRYDTKSAAGFTDPSSWTFFDTAKLEGKNTEGYSAGVFDGRYLYMSPNDSQTGVMTRFDTTGDFDDASAWSTFTANEVDPRANGYYGGSYDGRYVYFSPFFNGTHDGFAIRYDTTASFADAGSWSTYDMQARFGVGAVGFGGAVFDGHYVYFLPAYYTTVVRFDARSPPAQVKLPDYHGSFF